MNLDADFTEVQRQLSSLSASLHRDREAIIKRQTNLNRNMSHSSLSLNEMQELLTTKAKIEKLTEQAQEWAECTAEWQLKWEKMRSKREKAVKEATVQRERVNSVSKQLQHWKDKYAQIEKENEELKTQLALMRRDSVSLPSKSPTPNSVEGQRVDKCASVTSGTTTNGQVAECDGCGASRKSDEGFDSASENLSPAQSVDLHTAFSLQPQLKLIEALVHRNEEPRKSTSTSRSPSPADAQEPKRKSTHSKDGEAAALRLKCEQLEKQLQEERRARLTSRVSFEDATTSLASSTVTTTTSSTATIAAASSTAPQKGHTSQIPVSANKPSSGASLIPHHISNKRVSLKAGSKVTHEYITRNGKECYEEVLL